MRVFLFLYNMNDCVTARGSAQVCLHGSHGRSATSASSSGDPVARTAANGSGLLNQIAREVTGLGSSTADRVSRQRQVVPALIPLLGWADRTIIAQHPARSRPVTSSGASFWETPALKLLAARSESAPHGRVGIAGQCVLDAISQARHAEPGSLHCFVGCMGEQELQQRTPVEGRRFGGGRRGDV